MTKSWNLLARSASSIVNVIGMPGARLKV
jgi:hypothetical protein